MLSMIRRRDGIGGDGMSREVRSLPKSEQQLDRDALSGLLRELWGHHPLVAKHGRRLIDLTWRGVQELREMEL